MLQIDEIQIQKKQNGYVLILDGYGLSQKREFIYESLYEALGHAARELEPNFDWSIVREERLKNEHLAD